jgi:Bcr/CflA subfamily drug resistance transporter
MRSNSAVLVIALFAACLAQVATDIYLPAVPALAHAFSVPISAVQWSISSYMFGLAISQLVYGPISDSIGRRTPLAVGLIVMLSGSLICICAYKVDALVVGRAIQGCGAGACACQWRAVLRDIFHGKELAQYGAYLSSIMMFVVSAAPMLGGYLQHLFGPIANFVFVAGYALLALLAVFIGYKDTLIVDHIVKPSLRRVLATYRLLLADRNFFAMMVVTFLTYGALLAWLTVGSPLLIQELGLGLTEFGWLSFLAAFGSYGLAARFNGQVVHRFGSERMIRFGLLVMIASATALVAVSLLYEPGVVSIFLPVFSFCFGASFVWPNAFSLAFSPFGGIAGFAGGLYGFSQVLGGAVFSGLATHLSYRSPIPVGLTMTIASAVAWMVFEKS